MNSYRFTMNSHKLAVLVAVLTGVALLALFLPLFPAAAAPQQAPQQASKPVPALSPYIDTHSHMDIADPERSIESALNIMAEAHARKLIFMPSPFGPGDSKVSFEAEKFMAVVKKHPNQLAFLGGGGTLNVMIQEQANKTVSPETLRKFREQAEKLLSEGAVGFGEISAEHIPSASSPSYSAAPPDGPLFMALAEIAAQHNVPIVLHMESAPKDMPTPSGLKSPPIPAMIRGNIEPLERLLSRNPRASIVWAHAGSTDNYGTRTAELCRRLLAAHPNLYMEIKIEPINLGKNPVIDAEGKIRPEWMKLFEDYPNQFLLGTDQNYPPPQQSGMQRWQAEVLMFNQLSPALRRKIGLDNPTRVYFGKHKAAKQS